jgi:hypothetical protein
MLEQQQATTPREREAQTLPGLQELRAVVCDFEP